MGQATLQYPRFEAGKWARSPAEGSSASLGAAGVLAKAFQDPVLPLAEAQAARVACNTQAGQLRHLTLPRRQRSQVGRQPWPERRSLSLGKDGWP